MGLFSRHNREDVIYLTCIQAENEQLPKDKIRILYCDAKGNVDSAVIESSLYEVAKGYIQELERIDKYCAILGTEITPGKSVPIAVEISREQADALDSSLEHALKRRIIPDILKRYLKDIIRLGETKRKELASQYEQARLHAISGETHEVLRRLAYYPEDGIDVAIPIYKAEYNYPIVVLKRLPPNEHMHPDMQRLLILDSDGDLAITRVPLEIIDEAEKTLEKWKKKNNSEGCILCPRYSDSPVMSQMEISEFQRKALDIIASNFEETGHGERPISTDAQSVLAKAKTIVSPKHQLD